MSDLSGADLDQLDALATAYHERGADIAERARDLDRRVARTVTTFQTALTDLRTQTATANDVLSGDVDGLGQTAAATTWTGANRTAFDGDLGLLRRSIAATTDALTTRIGELEHAGVAPFAETMAAFGRQTAGAGDAAAEAGLVMRGRVADQRSALHDAGDVGWTSV